MQSACFLSSLGFVPAAPVRPLTLAADAPVEGHGGFIFRSMSVEEGFCTFVHVC